MWLKTHAEAWEYGLGKWEESTNLFPTVTGNTSDTLLAPLLCIMWTSSSTFCTGCCLKRNQEGRSGQNVVFDLLWQEGGWWQSNGKSVRQRSDPLKNKTVLCLRTDTWGQVFLKSWFSSEHLYLEISASSPENVSALLLLQYFKFTHYNTNWKLFLSSVRLLGFALLFTLSSGLLPNCGDHHLKQPLPPKGKESSSNELGLIFYKVTIWQVDEGLWNSHCKKSHGQTGKWAVGLCQKLGVKLHENILI